MINRIRQYGKKEPSRDAHIVYVVTEGSEDERRYFEFFEGLSSNLNVITIPSREGKTDPEKLIRCAEAEFGKETGHYTVDCQQGDKVWFVIDTDEWEEQGKISTLKEFCKGKNVETFATVTEQKPYSVWNVAQSNPSFEIWLYYHFFKDAPNPKDVERAQTIKDYVDKSLNGGFRYESDPVRLETAIKNSEKNYRATAESSPALFSTQLFALGKEILSFVSSELSKLYNKLR